VKLIETTRELHSRIYVCYIGNICYRSFASSGKIYSISFDNLSYTGRDSYFAILLSFEGVYMKIVVIKPSKALRKILAKIFKIDKENT